MYADFDWLECVLAGIPTGLSASMMALVLGVLLCRVGGVVMPLLVVVLSLLSTLGIMVQLEIPGSTAVQILPISLLAVGVCAAVHILAMAYRLRSAGERRCARARPLGARGSDDECHDGLGWFPECDAIRTDFERVDSGLRGAVSLDVVIDSRVPGGL